MKDSIKKQSLPDFTAINGRFHESLSFNVFRRVKINFPGPWQTFRAPSEVLASLYRLITLFT